MQYQQDSLTKQCLTCQQTLLKSLFSTNNKTDDKLNAECRECNSARGRRNRQRLANRTEVVLPPTQQCQGCGETKVADEFYRNSRRGCGLNRLCKKCSANQSAEYYYGYLDKDAVRFRLLSMVPRARGRAKRDGGPFAITKELLFDQFLGEGKVITECIYLGWILDWKTSGSPKPNSPSLDKIIPALGYVPGNIQIISHQANFMKNDADPELLLRFANQIIRIYNDQNTN